MGVPEIVQLIGAGAAKPEGVTLWLLRNMEPIKPHPHDMVIEVSRTVEQLVRGVLTDERTTDGLHY